MRTRLTGEIRSDWFLGGLPLPLRLEAGTAELAQKLEVCSESSGVILIKSVKCV